MNGTVKFGAVGDIYLGGKVGEKIAQQGHRYPLELIRSEFERYDLVFANLEGPLSDRKFTKDDGVSWSADPANAQSLAWAGCGILNLSNNHIGDCGDEGVQDTVEALAAADIQYVGVGRGVAEARRPTIIERRGVRIGFLAYCDSYISRSGKFGGAPIRIDVIEPDIKALRAKVDNIVVSLHHGIEYSDYPEPRVIDLCRALCDAGADLVLGHHPHVIQGVERHGRSIIVYSLGNFLADFGDLDEKRNAFERSALVKAGLMEPDLSDTRTEEAFIFSCGLTKAGPGEFEIRPLVITEKFQVASATGDDRARIVARTERISEALSNPDLPVYRDLDDLRTQFAMHRAVLSTDLFKRLHRIRPRHLRMLIKYAKYAIFDRSRNSQPRNT